MKMESLSLCPAEIRDRCENKPLNYNIRCKMKIVSSRNERVERKSI